MKWNEAICGTHKTFDYEIRVRILGKINKALEPEAWKSILMRCFSYGKYYVMMDESRTVQVPFNCKFIEKYFSMRNLRNVSILSRESIGYEEAVMKSKEFELIDDSECCSPKGVILNENDGKKADQQKWREESWERKLFLSIECAE